LSQEEHYEPTHRYKTLKITIKVTNVCNVVFYLKEGFYTIDEEVLFLED
jgi:hypothetical protein